jgi:tetratricopeptide (TPR) repeat protein
MNNGCKIAFFVWIVFAQSGKIIAQKNTDSRLADQYYSNKEYGKAVVYYQQLFNKNNSEIYYVRLFNCYTNLEEYKSAERLIKKQLKRDSYALKFYADLGHLYEISGQESKVKQAYGKGIKLLSPSNQQIIDLANGYLKYKKLDYAIRTYQKGQQLLKGTYPFNFELAQVYSTQGDTESMLREYLTLLESQESYIQSVQNALQTTFSTDENDKNKGLLKSLLIEKVQKNPAKRVFPEMLIWVYIQEKNFGGAFIQAKALDKRHKELGERINSLAKLSTVNKAYKTAIQCYEYLIEKGPNTYYYVSSKMGLVNVYNEKIIANDQYTNEDLINLEKTYKSTINELGKTATTASLLNGLAHLQAFYMYNTTAAISNLNELILIPRLKRQDKAKSKIELADVLLFTGEIWEASLLYSQVEKEFKYDQLGEQAKFKNAKISFYTGDFAWAKTQLDVLKASTSKLIANDAMQLSILITDNIGIDTTEAPLLMFAVADLLAYQNKNEEALWMLDSLKLGYPNHSIADDILYQRYRINYKQSKYEEAIKNLNALIKDYSFDILADDAIYHLALMYDYQLKDKKKALENYKKIMFEHQSSVYVVGARKRYRELDHSEKLIIDSSDKLEDNGTQKIEHKD